MASLNLSSDGPSISKSYQKVVNGSLPAGSPTTSQWAIFSVSSPLVNVFQQDTGNKESVLRVQNTGEGELIDLIEEFSEGKVQFAYVKVLDPNTGLPKNVLIAWCGEGVPERTKGYFTSHMSAVAKLLHGYHVQITARADGDLTPEGIIQKVADASGAKYSGVETPPVATGPKPPIVNKPAFTPTRTGSAGTRPVPLPKTGISQHHRADDDGWGPDAPPVTRTQLEKVQPAYKPTRVNMQDIKSAKQSMPTSNQDAVAENQGNVVKGGYQPVGKVDIAAIRRQAREAGELKDDRPEPVRGTYEPVGRVDIAAIRSKAQKPIDNAPASSGVGPRVPKNTQNASAALHDQATISSSSERLTSLPKPKVGNKFGAKSFMGTKPPLPTDSSKAAASSQVAGASRNFADQGGKTPAQQWAEKKAREREMDGGRVLSAPTGTEPPVQSQHSGRSEWKSSYTGKSWAPVQTTHTGKSVGSNVSQHGTDFAPSGQEPETEPSHSVSDIRGQFAQQSRDIPSPENQISPPHTVRTVPLPDLSSAPVEPEAGYESETEQAIAGTSKPQSPSPPSPPLRESSPIRVAMPVSREAADPIEEQNPQSAIPSGVIQQEELHPEDHEDITHVMNHANAEAATSGDHQSRSIRAIVQYDYEKAEDNEIELNEGEYVTEIEMVDNDWWLGVNHRGDRGLFPSNYVEVVESDDQNQPSVADFRGHGEADAPVPTTDLPAHPVPEPVNDSVATALYDYEAAEDNELSFPEGAEITNIEFPDEDWWLGEYKGRKGLFPANYVELSK